MDESEFIDPRENFPNDNIHKVLNLVKPAFVVGLDRAISFVPKDKVVDSLEKCNSTEMKRQYLAFERALVKWNKGPVDGNESRTIKSIQTIKKAYFTALQYEANYLVLSAYIFDEYRKIRESGEKVD